MNHLLSRSVHAGVMVIALAGCSSIPKPANGTTSSDPQVASTEKLEKDLDEARSDLADLESRAKRTK